MAVYNNNKHEVFLLVTSDCYACMCFHEVTLLEDAMLLMKELMLCIQNQDYYIYLSVFLKLNVK